VNPNPNPNPHCRNSYGVVRVSSRTKLVYEQIASRGLDSRWEEGPEMQVGKAQWATRESPYRIPKRGSQVTNMPLNGEHPGQYLKREVIDRLVLEKPGH